MQQNRACLAVKLPLQYNKALNKNHGSSRQQKFVGKTPVGKTAELFSLLKNIVSGIATVSYSPRLLPNPVMLQTMSAEQRS